MRYAGCRTAAFALLAGALASPSCARAEEGTAKREDQLKAAYLFNFVKFVEWPAAPAGDLLTICFVGGQGILDALAAAIENKKVGNRSLATRLVEPAQKPAGCNVLYLDAGTVAGERHSAAEAGVPMLTVSDMKEFTRNGGMIQLFTENNRLRFNVNVDNAQKAGLRISSSLLQLAAKVEKGGG